MTGGRCWGRRCPVGIGAPLGAVWGPAPGCRAPDAPPVPRRAAQPGSPLAVPPAGKATAASLTSRNRLFLEGERPRPPCQGGTDMHARPAVSKELAVVTLGGSPARLNNAGGTGAGGGEGSRQPGAVSARPRCVRGGGEAARRWARGARGGLESLARAGREGRGAPEPSWWHLVRCAWGAAPDVRHRSPSERLGPHLKRLPGDGAAGCAPVPLRPAWGRSQRGSPFGGLLTSSRLP